MKVAYLTAGAGGMYCGSCLRDNTLAAALMRQGRQVVLIPVYTPTRTDEENVSQDRVYFGGINIHLRQRSGIFRRLPRPIGRLLDSPGLLRLAARWGGAVSPAGLGPLTVSTLQGPQGPQHAELTELIRGLREIRPDLVHLPNAFFVGIAGEIKRQLDVAVVCPLTGEDAFFDKLIEPYRAEVGQLIRRGAQDVDAFLAVTKYYAARATELFDLPASRVYHVPLGVHIDDIPEDPTDGVESPSHRPQAPFTVGYLARICPDKGLHLLARAVRILHDAGRACRLAVAGYLGKADRPYLDEIRAEFAGQGLADSFEYVGQVDRVEKIRFLRSLDVLSVPTIYREAKGLFVLEALSQGVPVVEPRHGSFPELIEATGGGLLFPPQDARSLAKALGRLMDDPQLRHRLGRHGQEAVRRSFSDEAMARAAWSVFERVSASGPA